MPEVVLDHIGWTYLGLFIVWNVALAGGMTFLWQHRQLPSLRMRKVPLLLAGVFSLHVYGALCIIAYPVGAFFSCTVEFWVMSIWLPFGIALFHAANSQFLHLASRQKHFAHMSVLRPQKSIDQEKAEAIANSRWRRVLAGLERADNINKTLVMIGIGMGVQVSDNVMLNVMCADHSPSSHSHCSSSWVPRSSILAMVFSTTLSRAPVWKRV